MSKTQTDAAFLAAVNLDPKAAAEARSEATEVPLAPPGIDPHAMKVSDIAFDPRLLDGFPDLSGDHMNAASRHVFGFYKSRGRDAERNGLLHRRITEFIGQVRRAREAGLEPATHVKTKVKASKKQTELLRLLAEHGVESIEDLSRLLNHAEA